MRPALQECRRAAKSMFLNYLFSPAKGLVRALGEQSHQNHEVGKREQPLIRPNTSGFGRAGDRFVRFALVENEHRIRQATRGIRKALGG